MPKDARRSSSRLVKRSDRLEDPPRNGLHVADPVQEWSVTLAGVDHVQGISTGVTGCVEMSFVAARVRPMICGRYG